MTDISADEMIATARACNDDLVAYVKTLDSEQISGPSACSDWNVAQVLSHIGSGGEIAAAGLKAAVSEEALPEDFNQSVWARWDAMANQEKVDSFYVAANANIESYEALTPEQRSSLTIKLGFRPDPLDVAALVGMRLNELALHSWDVQVMSDPTLPVFGPAASLIFDRQGWLLPFVGKPVIAADIEVRTADPSSSFGLNLADSVSLTEVPAEPTGVLTLPAEAWLRLVLGRLTPEHTPDSVVFESATHTIEDLRNVFPGF